MASDGFTIPLLIGGATTSRVHTAVKIEPKYEHGVVHVADASRAVGVVTELLGEGSPEYLKATAEDYHTVRIAREKGKQKNVPLPIETARDNRTKIEWDNFAPIAPTFEGTRTLKDISLETLRPYIDWTPFFRAWDLASSYPKILTDKVVGTVATDLFADGQKMLDQIVDEEWLNARAVLGFWPANAVGDDIALYTDQGRSDELARLHTLRQQVRHADDRPNWALADFIAPESSALKDHVGAFAVSTGHGVRERAAAFEAANDDYSSIMLKALADRLAEACAEYLHHRVRVELWGYQSDTFSNEDLIRERYQGIRPAPGYPACPDHTEKATIFELLDAPNAIGVNLTESFAMDPAASVSGLYFAHPQSRYFGVRRIESDQLADYAVRKGISEAEAARWLAPVLAD